MVRALKGKTMQKAFVLIAIFIVMLTSGPVRAVNLCQDVLFDIPGFQIKEAVLNNLPVSFRAVPYNSRMYKAEQILGNTQDVLLGFSEYGHAYVVANKLRLDGDIIGRQTQVRATDLLDAGIIIRIHSTAIDRVKLKAFNDKNGLSCSKTACKALAKTAGLYVGGSRTGYFSPYKMLNSILKNGIKDEDGNKVPFDVYYVGNKSLNESAALLEKSDARITKEIAVKGGVILTGTSVTAVTLLYALGVL